MITIDMINIICESSGLLMCTLGAIYSLIIGARMERDTSRFIAALFACICVDLIFNMAGILLRSRPGAAVLAALHVTNFMEFFCGYILSLLLTLYMLMRLGRLNIHEPMVKLAIASCAVSVALLIVSQFNHMYYYIDETNTYRRGNLFWMSHVMALVALVIDIVIFWPHRSELPRRERNAFMLYMILPAAGMAVQLVYYGLFTLLFAYTAAAIVLFVCLMMDQVERHCQSERAVAEMQYQIMMSQIRPHFLFNSLTSIAQLCDDDPRRAKQATLDFAEYLRGNMAALRDSRAIPFEDELRHLKTYLALEKMRYDESLNVEYDIETTSFSLPALTIQPLVENAVKHGVGMKEEGGTVKISAHEYSDRVEVVVEDDGVGFDTELLAHPDSKSIGIANVRKRLSERCDARLLIESTPGKGTVARVILPRDNDK